MVSISYHWWNSKFQRDSQVASALMKNKLRAGLRVTYYFYYFRNFKIPGTQDIYGKELSQHNWKTVNDH